ncbi:MAG: glutamate racemase [Spirochaetia bacterium]|jgi:glutamate racemase
MDSLDRDGGLRIATSREGESSERVRPRLKGGPAAQARQDWPEGRPPVAFLDSGIGGLPYLASTRSLLPGERYVYAVDRENFPYGEKSADQVVHAICSLAGRMIERENPRLVVVACNTASVVALGELREKFPLPFVGVVPAVKPAAALSKRRRVGVLATRQTVEGEYLRSLIQEHASGCTVVTLPAAGLVDFVEQTMERCTPEEKTARVRTEVERFRDAGIDALVLGCTHFLHLEHEFRRLLSDEGIELVDSRAGVARQVQRLLRNADSLPGGNGSSAPAGGSDALYVTGASPIEDRYRYFASRFGLRLAGVL